MPSTAFGKIRMAGGDSAKPLAMAKRLSVIERHLVPPARRFLDCGCGSGEYVLALIERFGLDALEEVEWVCLGSRLIHFGSLQGVSFWLKGLPER